jgi:hypothetical protein
MYGDTGAIFTIALVPAEEKIRSQKLPDCRRPRKHQSNVPRMPDFDD